MRAADIPDQGRCVNLVSIDAQSFLDHITYLNVALATPFFLFCLFQITLTPVLQLFTYYVSFSVCAALLYLRMGWVGIVGFFIACVVLPCIIVLVRGIAKATRMYQTKADERVRLTSEMLHGIRIIKYYVWERPFLKRIDEARSAELRKLLMFSLLRSLNSVLTLLSPPTATFLTFLVCVAAGGTITHTKVFTAFSTFNMMRLPFAHLGQFFNTLAQWQISIQRIVDFLNLPDMKTQQSLEDDESTNKDEEDETSLSTGFEDKNEDANIVASLNDCTFKWPDGNTAISNVNITINKGELVIVVGQVGSGKSAFVSSLLGELTKSSGQAHLPRSVAYVPQTPWILVC